MRITGLQVFWIIISFVTGNTILMSISSAQAYTKQDVWISYLLASGMGIIIVWMASRVGLLYSKHNFVEYSRMILGKWLGSVVVIIYLIQWFTVLGNILSEFTDFINIILLPTTPFWVLFLTMLLLIIYVVCAGGIEGIARCSEVFGPIIMFVFILLLVLAIPNMDINRILPVFADSGTFKLLQGTLTPLSFYGESVFMLMLIHFLDEPKEGPPKAILGVAIVATIVNLLVLGVVLALGSELPSMLTYPVFDMIRIITMNFVQNLELIAVLVWILSVFIKLSLYLFLASYHTAELLKIKNWRRMVLVVAVVTWLAAVVITRLNELGLHYLKFIWIPYVLPINMVGLPILLLIVGYIKRKRTK